ncbi:hypothetical protein IQ268_04495 [Oculatella sp. LEGE 06141]|uniref:hypothetical protein n=1 Tax=Oculatella sp. LEGE 06141 TaxID=1828648 RepID=UPI0018808ACC|nr:hypothetical protein [Oculatella sp. LEGE 06141]MBE9177841.1 hypothetical protein [Oculatella sp. LEGE 06141]
MSNQISSQAAQLWRTISAQETGHTYQQTLAVTWTILKETVVLVWLVMCLAVVAVDWFWNGSIAAGQQARTWFNHFEQPDTRLMASEAGRAVLSAGKSGVAFTLSQAREQLGLPDKKAAPMLPDRQELNHLKPVATSAVSSPAVVQGSAQETERPAPAPAQAPDPSEVSDGNSQ